MAVGRANNSAMASRSSAKRASSRGRWSSSTETKSAKRLKLSTTIIEQLTEQDSALLDLPAEIRLLIYDYLVDFTGVVVIYAQHQLTKEINKVSIRLLHVCQLMREEVQALFYRNQIFRFCSLPAIDRFLESIGPAFANNIRNIQITPWLGIRKDFLASLPRLFQCLDGVERLTILHADKRYVAITATTPKATTYPSGAHWLPPTIIYARRQKAVIGQNTVSILKASKRLARGRIYYFHEFNQPELQLVPSDVVFENAKSIDSSFSAADNTLVELEVPNSFSEDDLVERECDSGP